MLAGPEAILVLIWGLGDEVGGLFPLGGSVSGFAARGARVDSVSDF